LRYKTARSKCLWRILRLKFKNCKLFTKLKRMRKLLWRWSRLHVVHFYFWMSRDHGLNFGTWLSQNLCVFKGILATSKVNTYWPHPLQESAKISLFVAMKQLVRIQLFKFGDEILVSFWQNCQGLVYKDILTLLIKLMAIRMNHICSFLVEMMRLLRFGE